MKNVNWKNVWVNTRLILMIGVVVFLYSFTIKRNENRKIKKATVDFVGENSQFMTDEMVNKLLIENKNTASNIYKDKLDLNKIEESIDKHDMVEKSEVFVTVDGTLKAKVKQKTPIARYFGEEGVYYIDYKGDKMSLSPVSSARVPLVAGEINSQFKEEFTKFLLEINKDEFLQKNIIGVKVFSNGAMILTNRNYDYKIDFGRPINIEKKFNNYKAFFQKAVQDSSISKYRLINLRFTKQVVCTK